MQRYFFELQIQTTLKERYFLCSEILRNSLQIGKAFKNRKNVYFRSKFTEKIS